MVDSGRCHCANRGSRVSDLVELSTSARKEMAPIKKKNVSFFHCVQHSGLRDLLLLCPISSGAAERARP